MELYAHERVVRTLHRGYEFFASFGHCRGARRCEHSAQALEFAEGFYGQAEKVVLKKHRFFAVVVRIIDVCELLRVLRVHKEVQSQGDIF